MQTFKELTILLFSISILFFIILKINRPPKLKGNRRIADKKVLFRIIILFSLISGIKIRAYRKETAYNHANEVFKFLIGDVKLLKINDFLFTTKMDNINLFKVSRYIIRTFCYCEKYCLYCMTKN
jgi:hypothetical protein